VQFPRAICVDSEVRLEVVGELSAMGAERGQAIAEALARAR
jgi:hypothetical protein